MLSITDLVTLANDTPTWLDCADPWPRPLQPLLDPALGVGWGLVRHLTQSTYVQGGFIRTHALEMTTHNLADLAEGVTLGAHFVAFSAEVPEGGKRYLGAVARYCIVTEHHDEMGRIMDEWDHWTGWRGWPVKSSALGWLAMDHAGHQRLAQLTWGLDLAEAGVEVTAS